MMTGDKGRVYLVGAGCGGADLITVRGRALLESCQVVVYDDLIAPELLTCAPAAAERIYMGKRSGRHSAAQDEICRVLVEKARTGKTVVRLKGGDPFVFGRGGEEMTALREAGVAVEEVPGVSSAIAIPAAFGIPVTYRGLSRSVHIITAHTADDAGGLPEYADTLAKLPGTLVFLMGLSLLGEIAGRLVAAGMSAHTPAAVLSGGNSPNPAAVRGTLADIAQKAADVKPPAVIVVGAVAALALADDGEKPLRGVRVGVVGTPSVTEKLTARCGTLGAVVRCAVGLLTTAIRTDYDFAALAGSSKLLVFTSPNGVEVFFERLRESRLDLRTLWACRFAVIGAATGAALAARGITADICPQTYTSEDLAAAILADAAKDTEIVLFRSVRGTDTLPRLLSGRFRVENVPIYDAQPLETGTAAPPDVDYLCFASAGGVECYFERFGRVPAGAVCVAIGGVTAQALLARDAKNVLAARECTADGMVEAILRDRGGAAG